MNQGLLLYVHMSALARVPTTNTHGANAAVHLTASIECILVDLINRKPRIHYLDL